VQGRQLAASSGVWHGTGPQLSYQWQRCKAACVNVPGAVAKVYTPTAADADAALRIVVTGSNPAGESAAASLRTAILRSSSGQQPSSPSAGSPTTPPGRIDTPGAPKPANAIWFVQAGKTFQRVHEYTIRSRNTRLSDAIGAFGKPSCKVIGRKHVVASWLARGMRIDSRSARALPAGKTGCTSPSLIQVAEIRLTNQRWMTSLGLRVGDPVTKLRRLYPRSPYVRARAGSSRNEYYLVWRHARCSGPCTPEARRRGVNVPRLTAQVANGKVVALRLPVTAG
jgi:hypothetical protein